MNNFKEKYSEYISKIGNPRVGLQQYSYDANFAVSRGAEEILNLDDSYKEKALGVFNKVDRIYSSGKQYPIQRNYDILTTAFLLSQYGHYITNLDSSNIVLLADYFSLCSEDYIDRFIPIVSSDSLLSTIRKNCNGLINQGIMCSRVIQHAMSSQIDKTVEDDKKTLFGARSSIC